MYQRKIDVEMLNAVKSVLADVSSVSPSSDQKLIRCLLVLVWREVYMIMTTFSLLFLGSQAEVGYRKQMISAMLYQLSSEALLEADQEQVQCLPLFYLDELFELK